ncbi:MAG: SMI1/KNR4 family protein, partial [Caldilineaceae bacterium]|nr:SMI1/KNR4 family protein [Caldilineaceae bacterium]
MRRIFSFFRRCDIPVAQALRINLTGKLEMLDELIKYFPQFVSEVHNSRRADPEIILPPASLTDIAGIEASIGILLPVSYKSFLSVTRGFRIFGGAVQFNSGHPFFHDFPPIDKLTPAQQLRITQRGGTWPPPSHGMLCFGEYFRDADGDQVLFDVSKGLTNDEYPVIYYSHESVPPTVEQLADSFSVWLNECCIQQIQS